MRNFVDLKVS